MDDSVGVQVVHCLHNLSQVVDHYLSLFQSQVELLIDVAHQCEDVSMRTQLHDQTDIPLIADEVVQLYDPRVVQLLQNHHLQGSLVGLLHVLQFLQLHGLEGVGVSVLAVSDSEDLSIGALVDFSQGSVLFGLQDCV